jgi:hypothetical protein
MKYSLTVKLQPEQHYISVKGAAEKVNSQYLQQFYLNESFKIKSLASQNGELSFTFDKTGDRPPFDHVSRPVVINVGIEDLYFEYDGVIEDIISGVNQINEGLVELACYSGWYPKIYDLSFEFDFDITLEIPKGYFLITNGSTSLIESTGDNNRYHLKSNDIVTDIVLFASNKVSHAQKTSGGFDISVYCSDKMKDAALRKMEQIITGYEILLRLYGDSPLITNTVNYVYRPFGGWGYVRGNLVMMPEQETMGEAPSQYDLANSVHIDLHELAHNWWGIAPSTSYDWINEGAAEFSSLILIKEMFGEEVYSTFVEYHVAQMDNEVNAVSILDTNSDSPDRELNHYSKTTLMYIGAEKRFGKQLLLGFLKKYCHYYLGTSDANTTNYLEMCEAEMGKDAREYFQRLLTLKGWKGIDIRSEVLTLSK